MASSTTSRGHVPAASARRRADGHEAGRSAGVAVEILSDPGNKARRRARTSTGQGSLGTGSRSASPELAALAQRLLRIEAARRQIGCTREQLAKAVGVSRATLARMLSAEHVLAHGTSAAAGVEGLQRVELALTLVARATSGPRAAPLAAPLAAPPAAPARRGAKGSRPKTEGTAPISPPRREARTHTRPRAAVTAASTGQAGAEIAPAAGATRTCRVLVAEDDAATVELYRLVLAEESELSYEITVADTARECLERLEAAGQPYDLLLMDLGLADVRKGSLRGSLLSQLARRKDLLPRRVLVVSGISPYQLAAKRAALAAIRAIFLPKPFDVDDLLAVVRGLCRTP